MIASMARWMAFIGVFVMIVTVIGAFFVLLGVVFCMLMLGGEGAILEQMGPFGTFIQENRWTLTALAAVTILLNSLQFFAGYHLFWASRDFDNVARTNEADQDFLASGFLRLKTCAKISTTVAVFQLLVNICAGMTLTNLQNLSG